MAASLEFGITGRGCRDLYLEGAEVTIVDLAVGVRSSHPECSGDAGRSLGGGKSALRVSADTLALAGRMEAGGGGVHSCLGLRAAVPEAKVQYFDAGSSDPLVAETLAKAGIEVAYLGWRDVPLNLVIPDHLDRLVLESPAKLLRTAPVIAEDLIKDLLHCHAVLANSIADRQLMTRLATMASRDRLNLHCVLTPNLPSDYVFEAVLPWARSVCLSHREADRVLGIRFDRSLRGAYATLRTVTDSMRCGVAFVTLGAHGVLSGEAGWREYTACGFARRCNRRWTESLNAAQPG